MVSDTWFNVDAPPRRPRLIIADDHTMVIDALTLALGRTFDVVGATSNGSEVLAVVRRSEADCLLLDLVMPRTSTLDLIPKIHEMQPRLKVLVVTMLLDRIVAEAALHSGASGYVPKDATMDELVLAITEVLAGRRYVSPRVAQTAHSVGLQATHMALQRLTPRQEEVFLLLGEGKTKSEIARALGVSLSAIVFHKNNIVKVLGAETEADLRRYAVLIRAGADESRSLPSGRSTNEATPT